MDFKRVAPNARRPSPTMRGISSKSPAEGNQVETVQARLERKAEVADVARSDDASLGQMPLERRHKLLYGG